MNLEQIFEICLKDLAEYEKKQLIIMLASHTISHPSRIEADVIYNRVSNKVLYNE